MKNCFVILLLYIPFFLSCTDNKSEPVENLSLLEYENMDQFKNWSISPRDNEITVFDLEHSSDSLVNRFLVKYNNADFLVFDSGFGKSPRSNTYQRYSSLNKSVREQIPESLVRDYYKLGFEKMSYSEYGINSFVILTNDQATYWHFFKFDSVKPPQAIVNFEKINDSLYIRTKNLNE